MAFAKSLDDLQSEGLTQPLQLYKLILLLPGGISQLDLKALYQEANAKTDCDFKALIGHLERRSLVKHMDQSASLEDYSLIKSLDEETQNEMNIAMQRYEF